ncbi:MAG: creatininase family protein [Chromatiales bacterium]|nr:creatininase family protein [Chromatiales bacterium]
MDVGARVAHLTWPQIETRLRRGARPVVTVGARAKEHGFHLPMATDALQADWLGGAIAARHNVLVWPTLDVGHYPAFLDDPGSVNLEAPVFDGAGNKCSGRYCATQQPGALLVNTGISTIAPVDQALVAFASPKPRAALVYRGGAFMETANAPREQCHGGHGDELETSIMQAIAPDEVRTNLAVPYDHEIPPGPLSRTEDHPNFTPQGVGGNPTLATRSKGHRLLRAMLTDIDRVLHSLVDEAQHGPA